MNPEKPPAPSAWRGRNALGLMAIILALLFCRSFAPGVVHFSNDGPLGVQKCNWLQLPDALSGMWDDLNSVGIAVGSWAPSFNAFYRWALGPVGYAKFLAPIVLWLLGLGAWTFFRSLGFGPLACTLGGLAAALNATFLSAACWGVGSQQIAYAMDFFALALVFSADRASSPVARWSRVALAGLAVGINVMEAADIGAIFSMFVAAFVVAHSLSTEGGGAARAGRGLMRVAVIAGFAGLMAFQTVSSLVGTQIQGIAGTGQDKQSKAERWDWATQWSLPKKETLGLVVPGLFGYRMDTPNQLPEWLRDSYRGGNYWGGMGRSPEIDRYLDSGATGPAPAGMMRFSGGGNYGGILVTLVGLWALAQSLRREGKVFTPLERRLLWFCGAASALSLLLAYGRFAPFYKFIYALPYFSNIRNPVKFIAILSFLQIILFGFGIQGLSRVYLCGPLSPGSGPVDRIKKWWVRGSGFDRAWAAGCFMALGLALAGWLAFGAAHEQFVKYLTQVSFDEGTAGEIAAFSASQLAWFIGLLAAAVWLLLLVLSGGLGGRRARLGSLLLGALLVFDLGRADLPWIIHWDYEEKYASNPVIEFLRQKPYEHRVAVLPFRMPQQYALLDQIYRIEWAQHHFMYYNIQSLDVVQMPRVPEDLKAFEETLAFRGTDSAYLLLRRWQLTNTRYLIGPAGFLDVLNKEIDPSGQHFHIALQFDLGPKPGIERPTRLEEITATTNPNGAFALFEFTAALPRALLTTHWQVSTNDTATLKSLASPEFDPTRTVLVSNPIPGAASGSGAGGTVEFTSYQPARLTLGVNATAASVLVLNDKYDSTWQVLVDGHPAALLRCNYLMRGVQVPEGKHRVEFRYKMVNSTLYVTCAGLILALGLLGVVFATRERH